MHPLPYEVKRAHWGGTWHAIRAFRARAVQIREPMLRDMTPARFDILYCAWRADWHIHARRKELGEEPLDRRIPMADLRRLLGLAGSTVSRAAHRLRELRYVSIVRDERDGRGVVIVLTKRGEDLLRLAVEWIREGRVGMRDCIAHYALQRPFDTSVPETPRVRRQLLTRVAALVDRERSYAHFFGSDAVPIYDARFVTHLRPLAASMFGGWGHCA